LNLIDLRQDIINIAYRINRMICVAANSVNTTLNLLSGFISLCGELFYLVGNNSKAFSRIPCSGSFYRGVEG